MKFPREHCNSLQTSSSGWANEWTLSMPYFNLPSGELWKNDAWEPYVAYQTQKNYNSFLHCLWTSNLSPGKIPFSLWSRIKDAGPLSNKQWDCLLLFENVEKSVRKLCVYGSQRYTHLRNVSKYCLLHTDQVVFPLPRVGDIKKVEGSQVLSAEGPSCRIPKL